ncbi:BamA/TamA family outer membrane protein [Flaviaesturariibacter terrae]
MIAAFFAGASPLFAQSTIQEGPTGQPPRARVIAGPQYKAGPFKRTFLGRHYRAEWTEPVWVPVLSLDTLGGLTPVEQGGGRQTKTLRLKDAQGRQYVLRSIDKDYSGALPEITAGTFIGKLAKDQVSSGHPYAAVTVPMMADAAGVYHTRPIVVLVADDPRLGQYRSTFGNLLCLFEERPDNDESTAPNFGNSLNVIGTEKLYEHLHEDPNQRVDQESFVRARLFDMFLGDWGRHDDQWRWARFTEGGRTLYRPIPRDRDQAYALFDGVIPFIATSPEPLEVLETFRGDIKNLKKYNFPARYLDRQLANEVTPDRWIAIAQDLQQRLTDSVIEASVRQLPPEIFQHSGETIIAKLKSRRSHLAEYAKKYSHYLGERVDIVGTSAADRFEVRPGEGRNLEVHVYGANGTPYYSRSFDPHETTEIRLYGLSGSDRFDLAGKRNIKVRVIGSADPDTVSVSGGGRKTFVYDNPGDVISESGPVRVRLSADTAINRYEYKAFIPNTGHTIKFPSYSNTRGIYFNVGYIYRKYSFRKQPFSWEQRLRGNYSFSRSSFGGDYYGIFNDVIGHWRVLLSARYDQRLKHYFFGIGNETKFEATNANYYQLFTEEAAATAGLERPIGKHQRFGIAFGYDNIRVRIDTGYSTKVLPFTQANAIPRKTFGSAALYYAFHAVDNEVIPTKGFSFDALARHTVNTNETSRSFQRYEATASAYFPLSSVVSLVVHGGGATVNGDVEFYQLPTLGGGASLRGYRRERFYGKSVLFNQNELRFLWNMHSWLFNGKAGPIAFFDNGRVWNPGEQSNAWHTGFGAGLMLAPFNKIAITVAYGITPESKVVNLRLGTKVF